MGNSNSISDNIVPKTCATCQKIVNAKTSSQLPGDCSNCNGFIRSKDYKYCNFCSNHLNCCNLCGITMQ